MELTAEQLAALARQGSVVAERRGPTRRVFKLVFRYGGRQVVRYLTTDPVVAEQARRALETLQHARRAERAMQRAVRTARRALRDSKTASAPLLAQMGLSYHGYALRRRRPVNVAAPAVGPAQEQTCFRYPNPEATYVPER